MTDRELLKMALEALELYQSKMSVQMFDDTAKALRERLAQPEQEPEQEPLTDEQIDALLVDEKGLPNSHLEFARAIEAAHGIGEKK